MPSTQAGVFNPLIFQPWVFFCKFFRLSFSMKDESVKQRMKQL